MFRKRIHIFYETERKMPRIVVLDNLSEEGLKMMKEAGIEYEVRTGLKGEDLRQTLNEFDAAICRSGVKITPNLSRGTPASRPSRVPVSVLTTSI